MVSPFVNRRNATVELVVYLFVLRCNSELFFACLSHSRFIKPLVVFCTADSLPSTWPTQVREQISREWIQDLGLISAENSEVERHREDSLCLDSESKKRDRKLVFDHGERETIIRDRTRERRREREMGRKTRSER